MAKSLLIVDDHPVVLFGLRFLLQDDRRFEIAAEASDADHARSLAERHQPDFTILDLVLGGVDGHRLIRDLMLAAPATRILIYSSQNERLFARKCASAGAWGYVSKSSGLPVVAKALSAIASGRRYFSSQECGEPGGEPMLPTTAPVPGLERLSDRELQVLRMIGQGESSRGIAKTLGLSVKTIGTFRERIKFKLELENVRDLCETGRDFVTEKLG